MFVFQTIINLILEIFKKIPYFDKWLSKTELQKEEEAKQKVDKEHDQNSETGRPSGDFWKDHNP